MTGNILTRWHVDFTGASPILSGSVVIRGVTLTEAIRNFNDVFAGVALEITRIEMEER